jgi:hypothetical protein
VKQQPEIGTQHIIAQQKKFIYSVKGEVFLRGTSILYDLNTQPSTQEGVITCRGISYQLICNCYAILTSEEKKICASALHYALATSLKRELKLFSFYRW